MNTCFFKWRKAHNERQVKEKIVALDKAFSTAHAAFKDHFCIFEESKISDHRKVQATTQMFNRNVTRLQGYFTNWRQATRKTRLALF
jgi:hypothetical protein